MESLVHKAPLSVIPKRPQFDHEAIETKERSSQDFNHPSLFLNRELSWLKFNGRVLEQAINRNSPLLERVKFLAISGSNMDEFYMKRIGGLKQQVAAGILDRTIDGRTPQQQIDECISEINTYLDKKEQATDELFADLGRAGIVIEHYSQLPECEQSRLRTFFYDNIFPLITPQSVDPAHPFPFVSNLSLNLLVTLRYPGDEDFSLARVKVPVGAGAQRFQRVSHDDYRLVLIEDLMEHNLDLLFPGMEIMACELFRVTRNANTSKEEEHADDLLELIETTLQYRRVAPIVRLQVTPDISPSSQTRLVSELGLDKEKDVSVTRTMPGLRDLWELYDLDLPEYKEAPHHPIDHPLLSRERNIFHSIREHREILLQHPYESFTSSVGRFLYEAASDPKVRGIKMTLYRTDPDSEIISFLIRAAQNGKQVAVVVELKASFDEQSNIKLASRMEEAGIHVTYGVVGLKTHTKMILVIRQDYNGLRRYVHIGTGNYHPVTARLYSDLGLFFYDRDIGRDATELFNYLTTGFTPKRCYKKLLPAPKILKKILLEKIEREIDQSTDDSPGLIRFKMNALEDADISKALYRAAQAGVRVDLLVRDSCRIRPGLLNLSETIRVVSIIGRFLEHARIYYFHNGGQEEYFIGSADAMKRNLEFRVEALVPVQSEGLRRQLYEFMEIQLNDKVSAWELQSDGCYIPAQRHPGTTEEGCQDKLITLAEKRLHGVQRLRKRKSRHAGERKLNIPLTN